MDEQAAALWVHHHAQWRDPMQVFSIWEGDVDRRLLRYQVQGAWWETLAATGATLVVTREYEHLVMAFTVADGEPQISYLSLPHPSGVTYDADRATLHIAATRNPNQVFDFRQVTGLMPRLDMPGELDDAPLVPVRTRFFPGSLYMHDLAMVEGGLYANSVGQNAVVRLHDDGRHERVWWPRCIEVDGEPVFGQNHLQLNSIAAGSSLAASYFSASIDYISARRPGHKNFPVDRRGVIFAGATRDVMARGLTRPHSARLHGGRVWVDNSGYGELGYIDAGRLQVMTHLPGWTRGLCFHDEIAFVGTSRVLPRFRQYAPGLDVDRSVCGLHAVEVGTGEIVGSLVWPYGNQVFAIELVPAITGFPFRSRRAPARERKLFYAFELER